MAKTLVRKLSRRAKVNALTRGAGTVLGLSGKGFRQRVYRRRLALAGRVAYAEKAILAFNAAFDKARRQEEA